MAPGKPMRLFIAVSVVGLAMLLIDRVNLVTSSLRSKVKQNKGNVTIGLMDYCVGDSYTKLKKLVAYNRHECANRWGYNVLSGNDQEFPLETFVKPLAWLKAAFFYQILSSSQTQDFEWFLWIDCDALLTRFELSVTELLQDLDVRPEHHVIVAKDPHTDFNSGVMFVRNSVWTRDLWKHTLQMASNASIREHKWWEQQALLTLYQENKHEEATHIHIIPDRWKINAFQTFRRNEYFVQCFQFCVAQSGLSKTTRVQ